ncbi:MAG: peptidylprolyl isomerase [Anaerolineae bacterium]|jgi:FKBP-type peptidyl-prolyl cis-trans isomerase SlyD|nr:peptidylprolyl isomerase [Anaerolineae bacterium]
MAFTLKQDMVGTIAYTLTVDGAVVEVIKPENAVEYLHGADNLVPGLEAALEGKAVGDSFDVTVLPEDGYGEYDEDEIEEMDAGDFEDFGELEPGMEIELMDEDGDIYEATVLEVTGSVVRLDFNSPLAGKTLHYTVQVMAVREASDEELEMGLPASLIDELYSQMDEEDEEDGDEHDHDHDHDHDPRRN